MSKTNALASIDLAQLATVVGGLEVTGEGKVNIGAGGGDVDVKGTFKRSNYESCIAKAPVDKMKEYCGLPPAN